MRDDCLSSAIEHRRRPITHRCRACGSTSAAAAYKGWIAGSLAPAGALTVDAGAAAALAKGKSLHSAGVKAVDGRVGKGDAVLIVGPDGREVGRGLTRYDAADAARIAGLRSDAIEPALGYTAVPVVHADDLALSSRPENR